MGKSAPRRCQVRQVCYYPEKARAVCRRNPCRREFEPSRPTEPCWRSERRTPLAAPPKRAMRAQEKMSSTPPHGGRRATTGVALIGGRGGRRRGRRRRRRRRRIRRPAIRRRGLACAWAPLRERSAAGRDAPADSGGSVLPTRFHRPARPRIFTGISEIDREGSVRVGAAKADVKPAPRAAMRGAILPDVGYRTLRAGRRGRWLKELGCLVPRQNVVIFSSASLRRAMSMWISQRSRRKPTGCLPFHRRAAVSRQDRSTAASGTRS